MVEAAVAAVAVSGSATAVLVVLLIILYNLLMSCVPCVISPSVSKNRRIVVGSVIFCIISSTTCVCFLNPAS